MSSMDKQKLIFPLAYDPDLEEKEQQEIYYRYLNAAFEEPRIKNIGVVGSYGVGKSSLLHSYEKKRKKKFLYITMGKSKDNNTDSKNAIERRILLQIYSRFHEKDIPLSGFEMIREKATLVKAKVFFGAIWLLAILLLTFYAPLGKLLKAKLPVTCCLVRYKTQIHILLYIIAIMLGMVIACYLLDKMMLKMHLKNVSLKSENAEIEIEREENKDYLDRYSTEIVYCLEQTAKQIDYTVVLEDMDRMNLQDVIEIFARLKEINFMVNQRLRKKNKYIRFVYVVNDAVLARMEHYKFFDYVLSIVPGVNAKTSSYVFQKNLTKVNDYLKTKLDNKILNNEFEEMKSTNPDTLINRAAPHIADYRLQYMVLNDYSLFVELHAVHNEIKKEQRTAEKLLALAIYKNVWPEYYEKLSTGKQNNFYTLSLQAVQHSDLAAILTDAEHPYLTYDSLCYLGYSSKEIMDDLAWEIIKEENPDKQIKLVQNMPNSELACESLEVILFTDGRDDKDADKKLLYEEILRFFIRNEYKKTRSFFENRDLKLCLEILAELVGERIYIYIRWAREEDWAIDTKNGCDIFRYCQNRDKLTRLNELTEQQFKCLIEGLEETEEFRDVHMNVVKSDNSKIKVDLGESVRESKIVEVQ